MVTTPIRSKGAARSVRRTRRGLRSGVVVALAVLVAGCVPTGVTHPTLVADIPTEATPHVTNGDVRAVAVAGDVVVLGGNFTRSTDPDGTAVNRRYLLAFDRSTGRILRRWAPQLDGEVFSVVAAPDGRSVYVGGRFNTVDGVAQSKVARLATSDGSRMPFRADFDSVVTTLAVSGGRLYAGGVFQNVQGRNRRLVGLDLESGRIDDRVDVHIAGTHRGGEGKIWRIEPSPDGRHLIVVGDFATASGQARNQIVKLATNDGGTMTVDRWSTTEFRGYCEDFPSYVRDVAYSPDSSYFVVVSTGDKGSGVNGTCASTTRWANDSTGGAGHQWIDYSGGDSIYSVEVTGIAVYIGGHFRWTNNADGDNVAGAGSVPNEGLAALDPSNGLPLAWNPGRDRGRAVWQIVATDDGLYFASDTDRIARYLYRGRIAFFPVAGGRAVPSPVPLDLPAQLDQYVPAAGGRGAQVVERRLAASGTGAPGVAVRNASALAGARAAFAVDGTLYTAHGDGSLRARSFAGSTLGASRSLDLHGLTDFAAELRTMRGAVYDGGRLYYTLAGTNTLYMRTFSLDQGVVGDQRSTVATSGGGLSYADVGGMVLAGGRVFYVDRPSGTLVRASWRTGGGIDPASRTQIAPAGSGGYSWTTSVIWATPR